MANNTDMSTLMEYLDLRRCESSERIWLRDRKGEQYTEWSWEQAGTEIDAMAAWLEQRFGSTINMAILSKNRAHWLLSDYAIISSGNVVVPIFTTSTANSAQYVLDFAEVKVLFLGEAENWDAVSAIVPPDCEIVTFPGVTIDRHCHLWADIIQEYHGHQAEHQCTASDVISIIFTSGTTGVPKGVVQTQASFVIPIQRALRFFNVRPEPRFLSYLPLTHVAERQLLGVQSLLINAVVTFNESLATLPRDMHDTRPHFFFGAPRVWEQLQQLVTASFGSPEAVSRALEQDKEGTGTKVRELLGFQDASYLLTAAAPTPPALIQWFAQFGIQVMEGFGQTEAMCLMGNTKEAWKLGSIGRPNDDVEVKISAEGELLVKAAGLATGYYKMPDKTAETFRDGWVHTGDKARIDEDGFVFLGGRVKDYFKTIHGKFVAPTPIENRFAKNDRTEQLCLLGRGYSKTVVVCVLSAMAQQQDRELVESELNSLVAAINEAVADHERIGAVIITNDSWTIESGVLTPTLKIKRDEVENRFGEKAQQLAHKAAVEHRIIIDWPSV